MIHSIGLFVTLVDACNLDCSFCLLAKRPDFRAGDEIDYDKFVAMLRQLKDCPPPIPLGAVCFCGSGEPLIYRRLTEIVRETKKYVPQVSIVTNGVLLTKDISRQLLEANIDHIVVSVTGNSSDVYKKYQGSGRKTVNPENQYETVKQNVAALIDVRNEMQSGTQIGISYILAESSRDDYFPALSYWRELGVNYVDTRILDKGFSRPKQDFRTYIDENAQQWWESCCTCFGKVMNVFTDGRIGYCNCAYQEETILGNLWDSSLNEILNSPRFVELHRSFSQDYDHIPEFCKSCDLLRSRPILA
ncbi:radical SAM protein [Lachnospiraceae bacterium WCA-9-b2]|jgi:radical SAM protein with 4Fe4S-binding SPASM domain|uniref:Radical SAM protein n=1 Tax=Sporofaciens musculi TaxID=2681861 RepID=A0A7X3MGC8_9FIRM|nr:radical SAM/SPASM domain-containing protein [Sporofaciens musculi]MXP75904.1 radical SAM protein [Sporofaciens musculi]